MRLRAVVLVLSVVAAGLAAGPGVAAAAYDACMNEPRPDREAEVYIPPVTNVDTSVGILVPWAYDCPGLTATLQKADGTQRTVIPIDKFYSNGNPGGIDALEGFLPLRVLDGPGQWVITQLTMPDRSATFSVAFGIARGSTQTMQAQPLQVTSPASTTVSGVVMRYTSTGALAPSAGRPVKVWKDSPSGFTLAGSTTTGTNGRYSVQVRLDATARLMATAPSVPGLDAAGAGFVTVHVLATLTAAAPTRVYSGRPWTVSGTAFPVTLYTDLQTWNGTGWVAAALQRPAADGRFTRTLVLTAPGTQRFRVVLRSAGTASHVPDNLPLYRELTVVVAPRPTTITGTANPTTATVTRPGTKMSTYGHLKAMYTSGATGAFPNQKVVIQTRPRSNPSAPYTTVATAVTSSSGYYYANWYASVDADVRVAFISPYQTIASSFRWLRTLDVR
jgi:hypothetical protein